MIVGTLLTGVIVDSSLELEAITSIVVLKETRGRSPILLGTRTGEIVTLAVNLRDLQDFAGKHEKFGFSDAYVIPMSTGSESPAVFVCCDSNVFVLTDFSTSRQPGFRKKHRLYATDVNADVASSSEYSLVSRLPRDLSRVEGRPTLILMAGSTIFVAELQPSPRPVLRHFPVLGTPNKVLYHSRLNTLIVAILEDGRPILRFIDPDTGSDLSLPTGSDGHEVEYISGLGKSGSQIVALAHWNYEKDGRTWSYIVVSVRNVDNSGTVLIVTAAKDDSRISEGGRHKIRFSTKFKRSSYPEPVWSIATEPQGLILCSGDTVQYEMLDLEQKRLRKVKEHRLSSAGSWMEVVDEKLHAVTVAHSLEIVDYHSSPDSETMARLYSDDRAKHTIHCIQAVDTSCKGLQPITLLSDQYCGLWGMWAPPNGMDRPLKTIFQGELQASVRRFTRAKARPQWSAYRQPRYGYIKSSPDAADILGVSIDGSLRHFTILNVDAWRLLKFVQNLASRSPGICPFSTGASAPELEDEDSQDFMEIEWDPEPSASPPINMQVDGDILQRVLDKQALENLVPAYAARFRELLDALDGGEHTQQFKESGELPDYYDLAYEVLEYFLSPVL